MSEPSWHEVFIASRELLATLPTSICCNCGGTRQVDVRRVQLHRTDPLHGVITHLRFSLPVCPDCVPTLRARDPRIDGVTVHGVALAVGSAVLVFLIGAEFSASLWQTVGMAVAGAALSVQLMLRWLRRSPRGARITNYQPVRFLGNEGTINDSYSLSFANPAYAALASSHCGQPGPGQLPSRSGAALPSARVVPRRPRGDPG